MNVVIAKLFLHASLISVTNIDNFVQVTLFSGIGLLLSLSVLVLDQYTPGVWF